MKICVVGLGYVGLPLAVRFGLLEEVNGFDFDEERIAGLKQGFDRNGETSPEDLATARIAFSSDPATIGESDFVIVAVPTPIDGANNPDLALLISATRSVGSNLKKGATVVFESTVYPGCTERDCVPVLEETSGFTCGRDFKVGYSPERINPGDLIHRVETIVKVVSGCDAEATNLIAEVYGRIIEAGVYRASSIMVAEAAKIIENTQRDINIALMNELKMIFDKLEINWRDVLAAAATKWNFLSFTPGLVGGHCIGVDPYYLAYQAQRFGHHPEIILAGRRINDDMATYEASRIIKHMAAQGMVIKDASVLILGATFKPNISDTRNSKVEDLVKELQSYGCAVEICDPHVPTAELFGCQNIQMGSGFKDYDLIVKAVDHSAFAGMPCDYDIMESGTEQPEPVGVRRQ